MASSPILSNAPGDGEDGVGRALPISCFLSHVEDSVRGLIDHTCELRYMSVLGGGVGGPGEGRAAAPPPAGTVLCVHACMRACVRECAQACACVRAYCVRACTLKIVIEEMVHIFHERKEITDECKSTVTHWRAGDYKGAGTAVGEITGIILGGLEDNIKIE